MQDLLRNKAERYFAVNYPSVAEIHFAQRKDTGANDDQYIGYDKQRGVVAWVYLEDLNRWSGVALDAISEVTYNVGRGEENEKRVFNNLMNHGWSTRFGSESAQPSTKPLLLVSFPFALTRAQADSIKSSIGERLREAGWVVMIVDSQVDRRTEAYGVDGKRMEAMDIDSLIDVLDALRRVKEAVSDVRGLNS